MRTTSNRHRLKGVAQSRRIPEWLIANRFGYQQVIHTLQQHEHTSHKDSVRFIEPTGPGLHRHRLSMTRRLQSRSSTTRQTGASIDRTIYHQPHPQKLPSTVFGTYKKSRSFISTPQTIRPRNSQSHYAQHAIIPFC